MGRPGRSDPQRSDAPPVGDGHWHDVVAGAGRQGWHGDGQRGKSALGINVSFGPSLDVLENPNPTPSNDMGVSVFGGDPYWVSVMGSAYVNGLPAGSQNRLLVVAEPFPRKRKRGPTQTTRRSQRCGNRLTSSRGWSCRRSSP